MRESTNYKLRLPEDHEYFDEQAHEVYNYEQIDAILAPTADPELAYPDPMTNGPHKLASWVGWMVKLIKSITGKANWWEVPVKSIQQLSDDTAGQAGELAAHKAEIAPHGQTSVTYYVDVAKVDNTGDGLTPDTAFKNLQYALDILKKNLTGEIKIRLIAGDYSAEGLILVSGFIGTGILIITGYDGTSDITSNSDATNYTIDSIQVIRCRNSVVQIQGLHSTYIGNSRPGFYSYISGCTNFFYCNDTVNATSKIAFQFYHGSFGQCLNCIASNKYIALTSNYNSQVVSTSWSAGSGNAVGLRADAATIMKWDTSQPQGTVLEHSASGGQIINADGDSLTLAAHKAETAQDDVHGLISEFNKKANVSHSSFQNAINVSKWYRVAESTSVNQQLNALIGFASSNQSGASGSEVILTITGSHIEKELIKLSSVTHSYGIIKVRLVHPTTAWTAGNYVDIYVATGDFDTNVYSQLLPLNFANSLTLLSTVVEDPEIPAGWITTEVTL